MMMTFARRTSAHNATYGKRGLRLARLAISAACGKRGSNNNPAPTQRRSRVLLSCLSNLPEKLIMSELFACFSRQV